MDQRWSQSLSPLYCLGDLVGYGTFPNEAIDCIRERNIPTLMGNYDQGVGNSSDDGICAYTRMEAEALGKRSIAWTNQNTTPDNKLFLTQLTSQIPLQLDELRVRRVPYDIGRAAQAIEASDMPNEYAEMLRTGTG
jgi:hypothetical protein